MQSQNPYCLCRLDLLQVANVYRHNTACFVAKAQLFGENTGGRTKICRQGVWSTAKHVVNPGRAAAHVWAGRNEADHEVKDLSAQNSG